MYFGHGKGTTRFVSERVSMAYTQEIEKLSAFRTCSDNYLQLERV